MSLLVIEPPVAIVTLAEAKAHLVVEHVEDDLLLEGFIRAACRWIDGPDTWLGRAIGLQVLEWQLQSWPCNPLTLPCPPEVEIVSIKYIDPDGVERTLPFSEPLYLENLPAVRGRPGDIKIRYRAGYGVRSEADANAWVPAAPPDIKVAVLMLVAQWYRHRSPVVTGETLVQLPFAVEALLQPYRTFS
ncbi:head-tail connector protein [Ensifer sp. ENS08]|uniref:head-tail connector protein n=1 Tax=Ensifer sp. ENS08 TaxID=2769273 RepID=UPI00177D5E99|nr:head-tail connector protein [Ensifer sp. ENS08]MBD9571749.1 phage head-tail connector protein [Ensifer sp. ENS08]